MGRCLAILQMRYLLCVDASAPSEAAAAFLLKLARNGDEIFICFVQPELGVTDTMLHSREELLKVMAAAAAVELVAVLVDRDLFATARVGLRAHAARALQPWQP